MRKEKRETGLFTAVDDQGVQHTVVEYTDFLPVPTIHGEIWEPRLQEYKLLDGSHVNVNDDGTLLHMATGHTLRRLL